MALLDIVIEQIQKEAEQDYVLAIENKAESPWLRAFVLFYFTNNDYEKKIELLRNAAKQVASADDNITTTFQDTTLCGTALFCTWGQQSYKNKPIEKPYLKIKVKKMTGKITFGAHNKHLNTPYCFDVNVSDYRIEVESVCLFSFNENDYIEIQKAYRPGNGKKKTKRPCTIRDLKDNLPPNIYDVIVDYFSEGSKLYLDIKRDNCCPPIMLNKLSDCHTKKEYLEKLFKTELPPSVNKRNFGYAYMACCALKYVKPEQKDLLFATEDFDPLKEDLYENYCYLENSGHFPSFRNSKMYAARFLTEHFYTKYGERSAMFFKDWFKDQILKSKSQRNYVDLLWSKNKIQEIHDEWVDKNFLKNKKCYPAIKIPETPLKYLKLPDEFELINNTRRLIQEGYEQHNCVSGYAPIINSGHCIIYAAEIKGEKITIEVSLFQPKKGEYEIRVSQCYAVCNTLVSDDTLKYVNTAVENAKENAILEFKNAQKNKKKKAKKSKE